MAEWTIPVDDNTDYIGNDIELVTVDRIEDCRRKCSENTQCRSYSYANDKRCLLKKWAYPLALESKFDFNGCGTDRVKKTCATGYKSQLRYAQDTVNGVTTKQLSFPYDKTETRYSRTVSWNSKNDICGQETLYVEADSVDPATNGLVRGGCIDLRGLGPCKDLGLLSNVSLVKGNSQLSHELPAFVQCSYNTIDPTKPDASWEKLPMYFEGTDLKKARMLWCGMANPSDKKAAFTRVLSVPSCTTSEMVSDGVDWRLILLGYLGNLSGWNTDTGFLEKVREFFTRGGFSEATHKTAITNALNSVTEPWSTEFKTCLNAITNSRSVETFVKNLVRDKINAHCESLPNKGLDSVECSCKNAIDGWTNNSCPATVSGCVDVNDWINTLETLKAGTSTETAKVVTQITTGYKPRKNSLACKSSEAGGNVLAYGEAEPGDQLNLQICNQSLTVENGGITNIKGDVKFSCDQALVDQKSNSNVPYSPDGTPDGADTGEDAWKILGLDAWIFFAIVAVIVVAIIGAGLFLFL